MEENTDPSNEVESKDSSKPYVSFPEVTRTTKKKSFGVLILVVLAVIIAGFFVYSLVFGGESKDKFMKEDTEVPSQKEEKVEVTPTPEVKVLDKKDMKVSILNGSGIPGSAGVLQKKIEALGFTNIVTGNADSYDYKTTKVSFSTSVSEVVREEVIKELKKIYATVDSDEKTSSGIDIQIVIGGTSSKITATPTLTNVKSSITPTKATSPSPTKSPSITPTI